MSVKEAYNSKQNIDSEFGVVDYIMITQDWLNKISFSASSM